MAATLYKIEFYHGDPHETFEIGVNNVSNINVHFNFANVVHIVIFYSDDTKTEFFNIPCRTYYSVP